MTTKIEWTDESWNPIVGCSKPLHWKKPRMIFVCSMGDLFHKSVPFEWIDRVMAIVALCPQHTFMFLTKRPERMAEYFNTRTWNDVLTDLVTEPWLNKLVCRFNLTEKWSCEGFESKLRFPKRWPLPNLWLGVTAENQEMADKRIPTLLQIPAAKRFVSVEPMLGKINFKNRLLPLVEGAEGEPAIVVERGLDWVICGGESGFGARPMHPDWVRYLKDQCKEACVPFFFKQWGEWLPYYDRDIDDPDWKNIPKESKQVCRINLVGGQGFHGDRVVYFKRVGKKAAGRSLDSVEYNDFPDVVER
jgi:protein gp37